jgi:hypothetical protein
MKSVRTVSLAFWLASAALTGVFALSQQPVSAASGGCCGFSSCSIMSDFCVGPEECFFGQCCYTWCGI